MKDQFKGALVATAAVAALAVGGVAVAGATRATTHDDASETPITGAALERASAAALAHVGTGKVTATEAGDEEGAYEVEVTRPDGSQVDVHLDEAFNVLAASADPEDGGTDD